MDFTKFLDMLERSALFFCRSDLVGDPFEGSVSRLNAVELEKIGRDALRDADAALREKLVADIIRSDSAMRLMTRGMSYINCWHMNECESAAMWKIYARTEDSIAVSTTLADLKRSLCRGDERQVMLGAVTYIDYEKSIVPPINGFTPFFYKRTSFAYEQELRALLLKKIEVVDGKVVETDVPGELVEVDLEALVRAVHISPTCSGWFADLVGRVANKYGLHVPVHRSELGRDPIF